VLADKYLELLALLGGVSSMMESARFNSVLFASQNVDEHAEYPKANAIQYTGPFSFNITSAGAELTIIQALGGRHKKVPDVLSGTLSLPLHRQKGMCTLTTKFQKSCQDYPGSKRLPLCRFRQLAD
jgi:hypothetical protein